MKASLILIAAIGIATSVSTYADMSNLKLARGTVLIAAPTAVGGPTNQGVWFVNPKTMGLSLVLPALASDQVYEGWIVDDCTGMKISTGIFRAMGRIDSDGAGKYAGALSLNFPRAPGSDFVTLGQNLADGAHAVVITVEPYPDADPNPAMAVLRVVIPVGTAVGTELKLENIVK